MELNGTEKAFELKIFFVIVIICTFTISRILMNPNRGNAKKTFLGHYGQIAESLGKRENLITN